MIIYMNMKKIVTIALTLTLSLGLWANTQAQDELYIYQHSGVTDTLQLDAVRSVSHSRTDLQGRQQRDYVVMTVTMLDATVRSYLLSGLDSVVMSRDGHRTPLLHFVGGMKGVGSRQRQAPHRTSMEGDFMASAATVDFFWTEGDRIYLEDGTCDDPERVFYHEPDKAVADFYFSGGNVSGDAVTVYYPGQTPPTTDGHKVLVKKDQSQEQPNTTQHIGVSGDCGTAVAEKRDGTYYFDLDHHAAYLCFLPYIANDLGRTVLKKITVHSDKAIAGIFSLSTSGLVLDSDPSHSITLTTGGEDGFVLPQQAGQAVSAYMVIAPQSESTRLTCEFTVYDNLLQSTGVYTKTVDLAAIERNQVYVIKANCNNYVVDLGLPVKFLNHNMGAFAPEDNGGYYAYGELNDKGRYTDGDGYSHSNTPYTEIADIRMTDKDVAHVRLGGRFSIPTNDEMRMLIDSLSADKWTWTTINGRPGQLVTGKNGNHLFFPAAGYRSGDGLSSYSTDGHYRTSTLLPNGVRRNWRFHISSSKHEVTETDLTLYRGFSIRPVVSAGVQMTDGTMVQVMTDSVQWQVGSTTAKLYATQYGLEKSLMTVNLGFLVGTKEDVLAGGGTKLVGDLSADRRTFSADFDDVEDLNVYYYRSYAEVGDSIGYGNILYFGRTYVDLGLPSGTKWANINVDAITDLQSGGYYAWGEIETKPTYTDSNYKWYDNNTYLFPEGLHNVQATRYDVASVKWNGPWMEPTYDDIQELYANCTVQSNIYYNGICGYLFTSKITGYTDRSIFIPKTGYMGTSGLARYLDDHYVPSSTLWTEDNNRAYHLYNGSVKSDWVRSNGKNVRPVFKTNATSKSGKAMYIRTLPACRKYDGTLESDTLKAVVRSLPADGTKVGFVWWKKGDEANKHFVETNPESDGYIYTTLTDLTAGCTYYYNVYIDNGNAEYDYANEMFFDAVGLVDLGLSVKWANVNMGAANEASSGEFYRWGATEPYRKLSQQYSGNKNITPESGRDICTNTWGAGFRMPTKAEGDELTNQENCQWTWETRTDGLAGFRVTSKKPGFTDRSIFLPAAGYYMKDESYHHYANFWSDYWCSTCHSADNGYQMGFNNDVSSIGGKDYNNPKTYGFTVRAVQDKKDYVQTIGMNRYLTEGYEVDTLKLFFSHASGKNVTVGFVIGENAEPEAGQTGVEVLTIDNPVNGFNSFAKSALAKGKTYYYRAFFRHGEDFTYGAVMKFEPVTMIDLDLPSGKLWANLDLGANVAEDNGDYYAWGESQPKSSYTQSNYQFYRNGSYVNIGYDIGGTQYDAATMNMSKLWRLPTREECEELCNHCNWEQVTVNGVSCYKASSKTHPERFIYFPKTHLRDGSGWYSSYSGQGLFMASNLREESAEHCLYLYGDNHVAGTGNGEKRYRGMTVRAIADVTATVADGIVAHVETDGCQWTIGDETAILRGNITLSGTVAEMTYGFIVGSILDMESNTPADASVFSVDTKHANGSYSLVYPYDGSPKYFRAYLKVNGHYYFGDVKAITAASLLDVSFKGDGTAFNGASSAFKTAKTHGTPNVNYNTTYHRYEANFSANTYASSSVSYWYGFENFNYYSDFMNRMADGHTLEILMKAPSYPNNNNESWAFADYENGGSGIGFNQMKLQAWFYIDGYKKAIRNDMTWGEYYHVVAVWSKDDGLLKLYVNGVLDVTVPASGDFRSPNTANARIWVIAGNPNSSGGATTAFNGNVVFARIYDDPLTTEQVGTLYNNILK